MTTVDYTDQPVPSPSPRPLGRAWVVGLLAFVALIAVATRFINIGGEIFQLDEYWHAELSTGRGSEHNRVPLNQLISPTHKVTGLDGAPPWWQVWTRMDHTVHPPLFVQLLRFWRETFGDGVGASRAFSATMSVLAMFVLFDVVRRLHGNVAALWACAIFALASPQIVLARRLRGYSLAILLLLIVADLLVSLEQDPARPRRRLIGLALATGMTMLTHYFTIFVLAPLGMYALLRLRGRVRTGAIVAMFVGGLIFTAAWGPWMLEQRRTLPGQEDTWIYDWPEGHVGRVFSWAASTPLRMLFEPREELSGIGVMGAGVFIVPLIFLRRRPDLLIWLLWLSGAVAGLVVMDLVRDTKHLMHIRYSITAGPAVYALLAAMLLHFGNRLIRLAVPAIAALGRALSLGSAYEEPRPRYDTMAHFIDDRVHEGDLIAIYTRPGRWFGHAMYMCISHESRAFPWRFVIFDRMPPPPDVMAELRSARGVWLVRDSPDPAPHVAFHTLEAQPKVWAYVPFVAYTSYVQFEPQPPSQPSSQPTTAPATQPAP